ncbi:head-binding protein [Enterobacter hormaechei]|nr:head-binding protein [Enterobacter hormaechei]
MATQPTNLPVPSESYRDLKFNSGKIDEFVTSMGWTYTDRFGQKHYTIEGINYLAQQAMASFGYVILTGKSFTTGATINNPNEVLLNAADGEYYKWTGSFSSGPKVVPENSSPESTGGIGPGFWVGVGDASLRAALAASGGSEMIGTPNGTVEDRLNQLNDKNNDLAKKIATPIIPCPIPTISNGVKAVVKSSNNDFYIISKRANGKYGFIAQRVTNEASVSDDGNYGGASPFRPSSADRVRDAIYAKLSPFNKSAGVTLSTLNASQIAILYGFSATGASINAVTTSGDFSLISQQVYNVPNGESVVYKLELSNRATIRLGCSNGASTTANISISRDGTNWLLQKTVNTQLPPSGLGPLPIDIDVSGLGGTWYVRIANGHTNPIYLVGLNINPLGSERVYDYDAFIATIEPDLASGPSYYFGGNGATEFAAKELSTGKFFGTFHGGHSNFSQRLRTENASYNLDNSTAPVLLLTKNATLHSASLITIQSSTYNYVASTQFGDGVTITNFSLKKQTGAAILCERIYTHMATSARNFDWIYQPVLLNKTDDGDVQVGQCGFIQQFRSDDAAYVNCYFSQVNVSENGYGGAYISFQENYNKQYYGAVFSSPSGVPLSDGSYTTCKEFF